MEELSLAREKQIKRLLSRTGRRKADQILVEGIRAIRAMLQSNAIPDYFVICPEFFTAEGRGYQEDIFHTGFPVYKCLPERFSQLADTEQAQGFIALAARPEQIDLAKSVKEAKFILYLDGIRDPGNLGTIIRSAAAFALELIVMSKDSVDYTNPKAIRASAGFLFSLPIEKVEDTETFFQLLSSNKVNIYAATADAASDMKTTEFETPACLVIGSEAHGLSETTRRFCHHQFRIRTHDQVESLNVAAAAAISMNHISQVLELL